MGKSIVFTFGRMNPPTKGHEALLDSMLELATKVGAVPVVFLSRSVDTKKNPLSFESRKNYCSKMFSSKLKFVDDSMIRSPIDAFRWIATQGYTKVFMLAGGDRVEKYSDLVERNKTRFEVCEILSAGDRDPDADGVSGISASKMRGFVKVGDFASFRKGLPSGCSEKTALDLFHELENILNEEVDEFCGLYPILENK